MKLRRYTYIYTNLYKTRRMSRFIILTLLLSTVLLQHVSKAWRCDVRWQCRKMRHMKVCIHIHSFSHVIFHFFFFYFSSDIFTIVHWYDDWVIVTRNWIREKYYQFKIKRPNFIPNTDENNPFLKRKIRRLATHKGYFEIQWKFRTILQSSRYKHPLVLLFCVGTDYKA